MVIVAMLVLGLARAAQADLHAAVSEPATDCAALVPDLDGRLASDPGDAATLVQRATCLYRVGRMEWALADALGANLDAPGLDPALAHDGAVLRVVLLARAGRLAEARSAFSVLQGRWEDASGVSRARALLAAAEGDTASAWRQVDAALARWPNDVHSAWLAAEMTALDPRHATAGALDAVDAPASKSPDYAYNRAVSALSARRFDDCLREIAAAAAALTAENHRRLARVGYSCAVEAGRFDEARTLLEAAGGVGAVDASSVVVQAQAIADAGDVGAAIDLLTGCVPASTAETGNVATLLVRLFTDAGRLDEALAAAGDALPRSRANLALALRKAGRGAEALALLQDTCPVMQGADAARCYDTVERWKK